MPCVTPISMLANTITPAMMGAGFYLIVFNAILGVTEGMILRRWFKGGTKAVWWMILANYLSAWIGWMGVAWLMTPHMNSLLGPRPIERVNFIVGALFLVTFAISVIVEAALVYLALQRTCRGVLRTMGGSLAVNAVSYPFIALWFLNSSYTLPLNASVVSDAELGPMPRGTLYWIDAHGLVMARALESRDDRPREVASVMLNDFFHPYQLQVMKSGNRVSIVPNYSGVSYRDRPAPQGLEPPEGPVVVDAGSAVNFPADYWEQDRMLRKTVLDLRPVERRAIRITFDWYRHYLSASVPGGRKSRLTIGWAVIDWGMSEPTVLPDDKVVLEWADQIVIFDPRTGRIAFIAPGTCPAFVPGN